MIKLEDGLFSAEVLADSIDKNGCRITTMLAVFPRSILAELNTWRMRSSSSASSRAIPSKKLIKSVQDGPFVPIPGKNQAGMQQAETLSDEEMKLFVEEWLGIRDFLVNKVEYLASPDGLNCHKQIGNRLIEPFMFVSVVITATDWNNMFAQRTDSAAEPSYQKIATLMYKAMQLSVPQHKMSLSECRRINGPERKMKLLSGAWTENAELFWHLPFWTSCEETISQLHSLTAQKVKTYLQNYDAEKGTRLLDAFLPYGDFEDRLIRDICVGRAAKVSYDNLDTGKIDLLNDVRLALQLRANRIGHFTPFEHVATPAEPGDMVYGIHQLEPYEIEESRDFQGNLVKKLGVRPKPNQIGYCANFRGWRAYRKELYNENITDFTLEENE